VLSRALDDSYAPELRSRITELTASRMIGSAAYRFAAPFLATIARGLDVSLQKIGIAVAIAELSGLFSPVVGHIVDRMSRRGAMAAGMAGVCLGTALAAASNGLVMFTVALIVISQCKALFDLSLGAWIIDHTSYAMRSRVIGLNETSWAAALLIGVSVMGLITAVGGWRAGYIAGAVAASVCAVNAWLRVPDRTAAQRREEAPPVARGRIGSTGWLVIGAGLAMTAAGHCIVITFGSWLEDDFGFSPSAITAVVFGLGLVELVASITSARRTDVWGKERSTKWGVGLMVPGAIGLVLMNGHVVPGLLSFALIILGFEFAIVSVLGLSERVVPGAPGRGLGLLFAAGTVGRALATIPATALYDSAGIGRTAMLAAALSGVCYAATWTLQRTARP
jgi:predicted MFS family arabinose efflux permease